MERSTWSIEAGVYGAEAEPLLAEIRRHGIIAELTPHAALRKGATPPAGGLPLREVACVLGYGTSLRSADPATPPLAAGGVEHACGA